MISNFKSGDLVVYCKQKESTRPGPRAKDVHPAEHGETYSYLVDKFWVVVRDCGDGTVEVMTRRGKRHQVRVSDARLRRPNLWERLRYRNRFPRLEADADMSLQHN